MVVIDSDAHVVETEHTWDYMEASDSKYRPRIVTGDDDTKYWVIDGQIRGQARGPARASPGAPQGLPDLGNLPDG